MKTITKIKISSALAMAMVIAMRGFAETSSASTAVPIQINNTIPEPAMIFTLVIFFIFLKFNGSLK